MKDELFDRKIKELADSCSEAPGADVWDRIEAGLDRKAVIVRWRRVLSYAAAAAVVAGLFVTAWFYRGEDTVSRTQLTAQDVEAVRVQEKPAMDRLPGISPVQTPAAGRVAALGEHRLEVRTRPSAPVAQPETVAVEPVDAVEADKGTPSIYDRAVQLDYIAMADGQKEKTGRKAPSFSVAASGHLSPTNATGNVDFSMPSYSGGGMQSTSYQGIVPVSEPRHSFPVSVGLELKYSFLNDRMGVGLGVNYTFLNSRYEALVDRMFEGSVEQSIHYIGVPLNLYVNILSGKRMTFYANVGCMVERAVRQDYDVTDLYGTRYRKTLDPAGVQWSANVGIGLEYRFWDFLGIYVDPRLTYFFDCGQPYSVRTEQPLQFNLEMGFRFHI